MMFRHLCFCALSQIRLRKFAAGCSVCVADTCCSAFMCRGNLQHTKTDSQLCEEASPFSMYEKLTKFSLFEGNRLHLLIDADTKALKCPELHTSAWIRSYKAFFSPSARLHSWFQILFCSAAAECILNSCFELYILILQSLLQYYCNYWTRWGFPVHHTLLKPIVGIQHWSPAVCRSALSLDE